MNMSEYYNRIYRLSFIQRYTNVVRVRSEDVAQHSFFVAAIVMKLHEKYEFDLGKTLQAAISHDITEADLSDVTHDVKMKYPGLAKEIKKAEMQCIQKYPQAVIDGFAEFEDAASVNGKIANLADVIQVMQYIEIELSLGNRNVVGIAAEARNRRDQLITELESYVRD